MKKWASTILATSLLCTTLSVTTAPQANAQQLTTVETAAAKKPVIFNTIYLTDNMKTVKTKAKKHKWKLVKQYSDSLEYKGSAYGHAAKIYFQFDDSGLGFVTVEFTDVKKLTTTKVKKQYHNAIYKKLKTDLREKGYNGKSGDSFSAGWSVADREVSLTTSTKFSSLTITSYAYEL